MKIGEHNRRSVAAMIENSTVARPQVGLTTADIVYEAVAEGGITRFMAIYSSKYPTKAGPIRSARSYYIDWLSDYDSIYVHAGGSPTAIARINQYRIKDYPHSNDGNYTREQWANVASEHTLFANISGIFKRAIEVRKWSKTYDFTSWKFIDSKSTGLGGKLSINFSSAPFKVDWTYNKSSNSYSRVMAGVAHKDRLSGKQITAKNIVIIRVVRTANAPYAGTGKESEWDMTSIGTGAASIFRNGERINGTWKKTKRTSRLKFFTAEGVEIELSKGNTWVAAVPQTGSFTYTPTPEPKPEATTTQ